LPDCRAGRAALGYLQATLHRDGNARIPCYRCLVRSARHRMGLRVDHARSRLCKVPEVEVAGAGATQRLATSISSPRHSGEHGPLRGGADIPPDAGHREHVLLVEAAHLRLMASARHRATGQLPVADRSTAACFGRAMRARPSPSHCGRAGHAAQCLNDSRPALRFELSTGGCRRGTAAGLIAPRASITLTGRIVDSSALLEGGDNTSQHASCFRRANGSASR
jgi:hypothetical protein